METERIGMYETSRAAQVSRHGWADLLRPEDLYLDQRWLLVAERTAGCPMHYMVLEKNRVGVAGLATALADETAPWVLGRPDTLLEFSAEAGRPGAAEIIAALPGIPAQSLLPALVCGGRHMGRSRVVRRAGAARELVETLVVRAEELARQRGAASVAYPFVEESDTLLREVLEARGYLCHESGRYSTLRVGPSGFEEYLAGLSSGRRGAVRKERRKIRAAGVEMRMEPLSADLFPRLGELEEQLMAKYQISWTAAQTEHVLREMRDAFGDDATAVLAVAEGEIRGFVTFVKFKHHWHARQAGFDYAFQKQLALYFETLFYFPIEAASRLGVSVLHYGLGSEETKLSRGCTAETQYEYLLPLAT